MICPNTKNYAITAPGLQKKTCLLLHLDDLVQALVSLGIHPLPADQWGIDFGTMESPTLGWKLGWTEAVEHTA